MNKKKRKPLRRAERWGSEVPAVAGRLAALLLATVVLGLVLSALQGIGALWLRITISALIVAGLLALYMNEGLAKGTRDAAASRSYVHLQEEGAVLEKKDDAACYHPLKALCGALIVFVVPFALAVIVALSAKPYTYALQDLPGWLTESFASRADVLAPLGAYAVEAPGMTAMDWMRMLVRLPEMLFINFFSDPMHMSVLIDRLSPVFILSYPLTYVAGYLLGPRTNRKHEKENRRAKKVAVRKASRSNLAQELTGAQGQVHYGHQKEEHKKKELI